MRLVMCGGEGLLAVVQIVCLLSLSLSYSYEPAPLSAGHEPFPHVAVQVLLNHIFTGIFGQDYHERV